MEQVRRWFGRSFGLDDRALAVLRVLLGGIVIVDVFRRAADLTAHYTDAGVLPKAVLLTQELAPYASAISLHLVSGTWWWQAMLFLVTALAALALTMGYHTRMATILVWYLLFSLYTSQPLVLQRGDTELLVLLFWSIFLPLGRVWSVDRALAESAAAPRALVLSVASAALTLQVLFVYFFAYWHKSSSVWRNELLGVKYAFSLDQYATDIARWLLQFDVILPMLTLSVLFLQLAALPLVLLPLRTTVVRTITILLLMSMHVAFIFTLHIGLFPFISLAGLVVLLPSSVWDWFQAHLTPKRSVAIYYDATCGFCRRSVWLIAVLGLVRTRHIGPAQADPAIYAALEREYSWVIVDDAGQQHYRFAGGVAIAEASVLFRPLLPLARVPLMARFGERVYAFVGRNRGWLPTPKPIRVAVSLPAEVQRVLRVCVLSVLLYFLALVCVWNLHTLGVAHMTPAVAAVTELFGLTQHWGVFSPMPRTDDGWFVHEATLQNGAVIDPFLGVAPIYEKPADVAQLYRSQRWRKFLSNLFYPEAAWVYPTYAQWVCRSWNERHAPPEQIGSLTIRYLLEQTTPAGEELPVVPLTRYHTTCQ